MHPLASQLFCFFWYSVPWALHWDCRECLVASELKIRKWHMTALTTHKWVRHLDTYAQIYREIYTLHTPRGKPEYLIVIMHIYVAGQVRVRPGSPQTCGTLGETLQYTVQFPFGISKALNVSLLMYIELSGTAVSTMIIHLLFQKFPPASIQTCFVSWCVAGMSHQQCFHTVHTHTVTFVFLTAGSEECSGILAHWFGPPWLLFYRPLLQGLTLLI